MREFRQPLNFVILTLIAAMCLLPAAAIGQTTQSFGSSDRMYQGDAAHTGRQLGPSITSAPTNVWWYQTAKRIRSSPVVANGVLYFGGYDWHVYALDAATGELRWRFDTGAPVTSTPAVANGRLFVGNTSGYFFALDVKNGEPLWRAKATSSLSPTVADGMVFVTSTGGNVPSLRVYDQETGVVKWHVAYPPTTHVGVPSVSGQSVFVPINSSLVAYEKATGRMRWSFQDPQSNGLIAGAPTISHGVVLYSQGSLSPTAPPRTSEVEQDYVESTTGISPQEASGGGSPLTIGAAVIAIDAETGLLRWRVSYASSRQPTSSLAIADNQVVVSSDTGLVFGIDLLAGTFTWGYQAPVPVLSAPTTVDGQVLFADYDSTVYALDATTGVLTWAITAGGGNPSSVTAVDGRVYVASDDGAVYAITGGN